VAACPDRLNEDILSCRLFQLQLAEWWAVAELVVFDAFFGGFASEVLEDAGLELVLGWDLWELFGVDDLVLVWVAFVVSFALFVKLLDVVFDSLDLFDDLVFAVDMLTLFGGQLPGVRNQSHILGLHGCESNG
jgi:hypothetical protein